MKGEYQMRYLSVSEIEKVWNIFERSVRYCTHESDTLGYSPTERSDSESDAHEDCN